MISEIVIRGFGIFSQEHLGDLPRGLIILSGDNESGKSTLKRFLKSALYGMEGKKGPIDKPLGTGTHGGLLRVIMNNGRSCQFILKGRKVQVHDPDGSTIDHSPQELLGGVDERLFSRIFCLGLEDLWEGEDRILDEDNLRSRIFAASSGLGHFSISRALSGLKDELSGISKWTSARKNTLLDEMEHKLHDIQKEMSALGDLSSLYVRLREEKKALEVQIRSLQDNIGTARFRSIEMKRLDNLIEPYQSLKRIEETMEGLKGAEKFPSSGKERYQVLKDRLMRTRAEINHLIKTEEDLGKRIREVKPIHKILQDRARMEEMTEHKVRLEEKLETLADLRSEKRELDRELCALLEAISRDWDLDDLEKADISMASAGEVEEFLKDLAGLKERKDRINGVLEEIELSHNNVFQEYHACGERLSSLEEDQDQESSRIQLENALKSLDALGHLSREHSLVEERIDMEQGRLNALSLDLERSEDQMEAPWILPLFLPSATFIVSGILFLPFFPGGGLDFPFSPFYPLFALCLSFALLVLRVHQKKRRDDFLEKQEVRGASFRNEMESSRKGLALLFQRAEELKSQLAFHCHNSGISMDFSSMDLDQRKIFLERSLSRVAIIEDTRSELTLLHEKLQKLSARKESVQKELSLLEEKMDSCYSDWTAWLREHDLPPELTPQLFDSFLQHIRTARKHYRNRQDITGRINGLEDYIAHLDKSSSDLLVSWGMERELSLSDRLNTIIYVFQEEEAKRELVGSLEKELDSVCEKLEKCRQEEKILLENMENIFRGTGVCDEEEFFSLHQDHLRFMELKEQSLQLKARLAGIAGSECSLREVSPSLENCNRSDLEKELLQLDRDIVGMEKDLSEKHQSLGQLEDRIRQLSIDRRQTVLSQEKELLMTEARELSRKWVLMAMTRAFLEKAVQIHEKQRQPKVISKASEYLGTITGGRYSLHSSMKDRSIILEEKENRTWKGVTTWSSGLADQAYIAVRLSLAELLNQNREPLPIILDDVHVRFDRSRQEGLAEVLLDIAGKRQIFFFSCDSGFQHIVRKVVSNGQMRSAPVNVLYCTLQDGKISPVGS